MKSFFLIAAGGGVAADDPRYRAHLTASLPLVAFIAVTVPVVITDYRATNGSG